MPKKKPSKKNDQSELPLDATPTSPASASADGTHEADGSATAPAVPAADSSPVTAPADEPAPKRQPGEKVQDEQAPLAQSYRNWFLEYASYVILDRAVPHIDDGLKPVQRRVLHTLWDMDDGRFHKVANVVGRKGM